MDRPMWTCPDCGRQVHTLEVTEPSQLTDDLREWLAEAYRLGTEGAGKAVN